MIGLGSWDPIRERIVKAGSKGMELLTVSVLRNESGIYEYLDCSEVLTEFRGMLSLVEDEQEEDLLLQVTEENTLAADSDSVVHSNSFEEDKNNKLQVEYAPDGKITPIEAPPDDQSNSDESETTETMALNKTQYTRKELVDFNFLLNHFYIVDSSTKATKAVFDGNVLISKDLTLENTKSENPQILIYHTHASETYADSRSGVQEDTVVGPGNYLTELLEKKGYQVMHNKTAYDKKDGKDNRNYAYITARPEIEAILAENPEIQVVIDLHRDAGEKRVTTINGKKTAQIMFFNGLCRNADGAMDSLENPYIQDNLAFSLQMKLLGDEMYPGLFFRIYLKNYRYNMHMRPQSLLVELGTEKNTVGEAYNAMEPLADLLDTLLQG